MNSKTIDALDKLKEVQLELLRLSSALEMMNRAYEANREWVGLTDEELAPIYAEYKSPRNIYLAIESALREKNT